MRALMLLTSCFLIACSVSSEVRDSGTELDAAVLDPEPACLPAVVIDTQRADAGQAFLFHGAVGGQFVPRLAFDNLWLAWTNTPPADVPAALRARYGFVQALTPNDGLPMGLRQEGSWVRADCLLCHAAQVAGQTVVGASNNRLDLELMVEDLQTLARRFNQTPPNPPRIRTGARGISDIIGMTVQLGKRAMPSAPPANTEIGYQDAPAWWTMADKTWLYTDGSGPQSAHRTMMATQLAFGATQADLERLEPQYIALREYLLTLKAPAWPFAKPDAAAVERGRTVFRQRCTSCHRDDRCERSESVIASRAMVGTDPARSTGYSTAEIALINGSWFGALEPSRATDGYLAPSLRGLWASAPYFHNGSVPTLEGVLDSSKRPRFFRVLGTTAADYDEAAVGLKVEVLAAAPQNPPRAEKAAVHDTTQVGLGNQGHLFGDALSAEERADVLAFLKTQ